jgi:hypothetical protein
VNGLVEFLRARLDEDEAVARAASDGPWIRGAERDHLADNVVYGQSASWAVHITQVCNVDYGHNRDADSTHIARHDPQRVLADVAAKRAIVDAYEHKAESMARYPNPGNASGLFSLTVAVQHLAAVYTDHPAYRQRWAP